MYDYEHKNYSIVLKNGILIDPLSEKITRNDIRINPDGYISDIQPEIEITSDDQGLDIGRCFIAPGLVDLHTHTRIPSPELIEDTDSITAAALAGGYCQLTAMPNTDPVMDNPDLLRQTLQQFSRLPVRIHQTASLTIGQKGEHQVPMQELSQSGACGFSDDGRWVSNPELMNACLKEAESLNKPVFSHCEDNRLNPGGMIHPSEQARQYGIAFQYPESESIAVSRDILLARKTQARLHLCHISTRQSCQLLEYHRTFHSQISAETAPHYFSLTTDDMELDNGQYKVNPPLRTQDDRQAIIHAIQHDLIDVIATDHAPHADHHKTGDFNSSAFGFNGLETALAVAITYLQRPGLIDWLKLFAMMTTHPARVLMQALVPFQIDHNPDLIVINPEQPWIPTPKLLHSRTQNCPFFGRLLFGKVKMTFIKGKLLYQDHTT